MRVLRGLSSWTFNITKSCCDVDGLTCMQQRYSRKCRYGASSRRNRTNSSSSIPLFPPPSSTRSSVFEELDETQSLLTPGLACFNYDFSQYRMDLGEEFFEEPLALRDEQGGILEVSSHFHRNETPVKPYSILTASQHTGPPTLEWDSTILVAGTDTPIEQDGIDTQRRPRIFEPNFVTHSPPPPTGVCVAEAPSPSRAKGQEGTTHHSWPLSAGLPNLMKYRSILGVEERNIVEPALTQLCTYLQPDCVLLEPPMSSNSPQQEVWKLVLDEDWRRSSIRG